MKKIIGLIGVSLIVALDQWVKSLAVANLSGGRAINIIDGVFELYYTENPGAAFGMLSGKISLFAILTVVVLAILVLIYVKLPDTKRYNPLRLTIVMLTGGAYGNFIDRIGQGFVVDMFHFYWFEFPIFNVADIFIVVSCVLLTLLMLFYYKEEELDIMTMIRGHHE